MILDLDTFCAQCLEYSDHMNRNKQPEYSNLPISETVNGHEPDVRRGGSTGNMQSIQQLHLDGEDRRGSKSTKHRRNKDPNKMAGNRITNGEEGHM